jgi:hypothetical protein
LQLSGEATLALIGENFFANSVKSETEANGEHGMKAQERYGWEQGWEKAQSDTSELMISYTILAYLLISLGFYIILSANTTYQGKPSLAKITHTNEFLPFDMHMQLYAYHTVTVYIQIIHSCLVSSGYLFLDSALPLGSGMIIQKMQRPLHPPVTRPRCNNNKSL